MALDSSQHDELYTLIENTSGKARTFSYLRRTLAIGEVLVVRGDLVATLGARRSPRAFKAFSRSLARDSIRVRSRPMPVLYDRVDAKPYGLYVDNGVLGLVDPTYESSDDANFAAV